LDVRSGRLVSLTMTPMQIRRFRLNLAPDDEARWLLDVFDTECRKLGSRVVRQDDGDFRLLWKN
ncbi:MAG: hypothetical protein V7606_2698, partial [Burkholderiales bacterium]